MSSNVLKCISFTTTLPLLSASFLPDTNYPLFKNHILFGEKVSLEHRVFRARGKRKGFIPVAAARHSHSVRVHTESRQNTVFPQKFQVEPASVVALNPFRVRPGCGSPPAPLRRAHTGSGSRGFAWFYAQALGCAPIEGRNGPPIAWAGQRK